MSMSSQISGNVKYFKLFYNLFSGQRSTWECRWIETILNVDLDNFVHVHNYF